MKYFKNVKTIEELKAQYKELAKKYHPDLGGDAEAMKVINNEYDILFNELKDIKTVDDKDFKTVIVDLLKYNKIEIEIIGTWIWLHGETYSIKEELKEMGFRWSKGKKLWYKMPYETNKKPPKYKQNNLETIRKTYGSKLIKNEKQVYAIA